MRKKLSKNDYRIRRRLEIERTLAEYPGLPPDRILDLLYWFKREATATEVAKMANNPIIADRYRKFRAMHLDSMTSGGAILSVFVAIVLIVALAVAAAII